VVASDRCIPGVLTGVVTRAGRLATGVSAPISFGEPLISAAFANSEAVSRNSTRWLACIQENMRQACHHVIAIANSGCTVVMSAGCRRQFRDIAVQLRTTNSARSGSAFLKNSWNGRSEGEYKRLQSYIGGQATVPRGHEVEQVNERYAIL
jgi:hypothetical protein